jgi:hypothetical protein
MKVPQTALPVDLAHVLLDALGTYTASPDIAANVDTYESNGDSTDPKATLAGYESLLTQAKAWLENIVSTNAYSPCEFVVTHLGADGDEYVPKYRGTYTWTPDLLIIEGFPMNGNGAGNRESRRIEYPRERVVRVTVVRDLPDAA